MLTLLKTRRLLIGSGLALASLVGAACGSDSASTASSDGTGADATTGGTTAEAGDAIGISGAWARTSPSSVDTGAAYMMITGGAEDDTLQSAAVDASIAFACAWRWCLPYSTPRSDNSCALCAPPT